MLCSFALRCKFGEWTMHGYSLNKTNSSRTHVPFSATNKLSLDDFLDALDMFSATNKLSLDDFLDALDMRLPRLMVTVSSIGG